ncbi:MAG: YdcF family protein [Bdellovibrionota bacterium]
MFILGLLVLVLVTEYIVYYFGRDVNFQNPELIVVLGCGDRVSSPLLNDRLEAAVRAYIAFPGIPILLTGDEKNKNEISAMSKYLRGRLPKANILLDPNSLNTWDSFVYIKNNFSKAHLLVVTNEFHQKRAIFFAKILKLTAKSYGKDLNFSNNWYLFIRERLARLLIYKHLVISSHKKSQA